MGEFPSLLKVDVSAMYFLAGREMVYCCSQPYHSLLILPIFMGRPLEVSSTFLFVLQALRETHPRQFFHDEAHRSHRPSKLC